MILAVWGGKDWRDAAISQGCLGPPEAGRGRKDSSLESIVLLVLWFGSPGLQVPQTWLLFNEFSVQNHLLTSPYRSCPQPAKIALLPSLFITLLNLLDYSILCIIIIILGLCLHLLLVCVTAFHIHNQLGKELECFAPAISSAPPTMPRTGKHAVNISWISEWMNEWISCFNPSF